LSASAAPDCLPVKTPSPAAEDAGAVRQQARAIWSRRVLAPGGQVVRPQEPGRDRAPWRPGAGQGLLLIFRREIIQALEPEQRQRQVSLRPNIGTSQRHEVVDVYTPRPEPGNAQQDLPTHVIGAAGHRGEIEASGVITPRRWAREACVSRRGRFIPRLSPGRSDSPSPRPASPAVGTSPRSVPGGGRCASGGA